MAYTPIPDGDIDADSPITTGLMTLLRDNPFEDDAPISAFAGSSVTLLNTTIVSGTPATVEWDDTIITSDYDHFIIRGTGIIPSSDGVTPFFRVSADGGATWRTTAIYSRAINILNAAGGVSISAGSTQTSLAFVGTTAAVGNAANEGINFECTLIGAQYSGVRTALIGRAHYLNAASLLYSAEGACSYNTAEVNDGLQFAFGSGNIAAGIMSIYGVKTL